MVTMVNFLRKVQTLIWPRLQKSGDAVQIKKQSSHFQMSCVS